MLVTHQRDRYSEPVAEEGRPNVGGDHGVIAVDPGMLGIVGQHRPHAPANDVEVDDLSVSEHGDACVPLHSSADMGGGDGLALGMKIAPTIASGLISGWISAVSAGVRSLASVPKLSDSPCSLTRSAMRSLEIATSRSRGG